MSNKPIFMKPICLHNKQSDFWDSHVGSPKTLSPNDMYYWKCMILQEDLRGAKTYQEISLRVTPPNVHLALFY